MKRAIPILSLICLLTVIVNAQSDFRTVYGKKANYSFTIPSSFAPEKAIGANIDLKFVDEGRAIVTTVMDLPDGVSDSDVGLVNEAPDHLFKHDLEAIGLSDVNVIKRGTTLIFKKTTAFSYYTSKIREG